METIYIDSLFFLNLVIDYLLLRCTAEVCALVPKRARYLAGALIGAAFSVSVYIPGWAFLTSPAVKLSVAGLMALAAYGSEKSLLRCMLTFLFVSAAFGGFIYCITLMGGYPAFDMRTLILSFALCYALLYLVFRFRAARGEKPLVTVELCFMDKTARFTAMTDTGNDLRDPMSGEKVMVVCPHAVEPIFNGFGALPFDDPVALSEKCGAIPELKGKFRLIPYTSVGESGILAAFRAERVLIDGESRPMLTAISERTWGDGFEGII